MSIAEHDLPTIQSIKNKNTGSLILDSLIGLKDYEHQLLLSNKMLIRLMREKQKNKSRLASLYILKVSALMFKEQQEYIKAINTLEKYKECENKNNIDLYYDLRADYAYLAHDYKNALKYVNEALLHKIDANLLMLKGFICHALEQYEDSKSALIKAIEYDDCDKGLVYYYLSEDYYALGEHKEALPCINQALMINQDAKNYYAKANILEALGRIKEAQECFDKYNELSKTEETL